MTKLILASASPRRLQLLQEAGYAPEVIPGHIDETPAKGELPDKYALRMACEKAAAVAGKYPDAVVLAADTVTACGRRILHKTDDEKTARQYLEILSGRRHRVYTAVCIIKNGKAISAVEMTQVKFSRLTQRDIDGYMESGDWRGKAGGCSIQGRGEAFIPWISGSYSNVVGLPIAKTSTMLARMGIKADD